MATPTGYSSKLRTVQIGKEATWGVAVPATARLHALDDAEFVPNIQSDEHQSLGTLSPATDVDIVYMDGKVTISGKLTMEDAPWLAQAAMGAVTATGANPYVRTYVNPHNQSYSPVSYTFEYGIVGSDVKYKAVGAVLQTLEISFKKRESVMYKAEFLVKNVTVLTVMAALTDRAYTAMRAADLALFIDPTTNTPGTTAVTGFVRDYKLVINTGIHLKDFCGDLSPSGFGIGSWESALEIKAEFMATTKAEIESLLGGNAVKRFIQTAFTRGAAINLFNYACYMDGDGQTLFEDNDGNIGVSLKYKPIYNIAQGYWLQWSNTNAVQTLPF